MKRIRNQRAISLVEVLASVAIFSVVAAGLTVSTVGNIKANATSKDIAVAWALVHDKVEQFRALDPTVDPPDLRSGSHKDALNPIDPLGQTGGKFIRTWTVTPDTPRQGVSLVAVTVAWNVPLPRSVSGVAYVCRTLSCN